MQNDGSEPRTNGHESTEGVPSDAETVEAYVTGRDTSEIAKTKAELAYMSMALDREIDIASRLEVEIEELKERLEHVTELLVDTWHTAMDGEPEKEAAVVDARAALEALK